MASGKFSAALNDAEYNQRGEALDLVIYLADTAMCGLLFGGDEEDRTPDLRIANATLSQLSYVPGC
jgi:hypothetical protein